METGLTDGSNPEANVTREQLVTLLRRFVGEPEVTALQRSTLLEFSDADDMSDWTADTMAWAVSVGLIRGNADGTMCPGGDTTRAEVAAMLHRFVEV